MNEAWTKRDPSSLLNSIISCCAEASIKVQYTIIRIGVGGKKERGISDFVSGPKAADRDALKCFLACGGRHG